MEVFFGILLVTVLVFAVFGPLIGRVLGPLLQKWAMGKMEDNIRRMAGMPTRKEEKKARKRAGNQGGRTSGRARRVWSEPGAPRKQESVFTYIRAFAEDVEFTEIKEFSHESKTSEIRYKVEQQVEDVEFTETKSNKEG